MVRRGWDRGRCCPGTGIASSAHAGVMQGSSGTAAAPGPAALGSPQPGLDLGSCQPGAAGLARHGTTLTPAPDLRGSTRMVLGDSNASAGCRHPSAPGGQTESPLPEEAAASSANHSTGGSAGRVPPREVAGGPGGRPLAKPCQAPHGAGRDLLLSVPRAAQRLYKPCPHAQHLYSASPGGTTHPTQPGQALPALLQPPRGTRGAARARGRDAPHHAVWP